MHVRRSRVLLLAAAMGLAAAFTLGAILVPQQAQANRASVQRGMHSGLIDHGRLLLGSELLIAAFQERVSAVLGESS